METITPLHKLEVELKNAISEIESELRRLGFGPLLDFNPPPSPLGSWGPAVPNPLGSLLRWNVRIADLEAQLTAIRAAVPPPSVNAAVVPQVKKPLPRRVYRGYPLSVICTESEKEDLELWRQLEIGPGVLVRESR